MLSDVYHNLSVELKSKIEHYSGSTFSLSTSSIERGNILADLIMKESELIARSTDDLIGDQVDIDKYFDKKKAYQKFINEYNKVLESLKLPSDPVYL